MCVFVVFYFAELMQWSAVARYVSAAQFVVGGLVLFVSWVFTYEFTEAAGVLLGAVMIGAGLAGYAGGRRKSGNLANAHLLACVVAAFLSMSFVAQVVREAEVDCGMSHLYLRNQDLDRRLQAVKAADALNAVYARMNELEDAMGAELRAAAEGKLGEGAEDEGKDALGNPIFSAVDDPARLTPDDYLSSKIELLLRHAQDLQTTSLRATDGTTLDAMPEAHRQRVVQRLRAANKVLQRIHGHQVATTGKGTAGRGKVLPEDQATAEPLTYAEYVELLAALTSGEHVSDKASDAELKGAMQELPELRRQIKSAQKALDERKTASAKAQLAKLEAEKATKRTGWDARYDHAVRRLELKAGEQRMQVLADHCNRETAGERFSVLLGIIAFFVQIAAAYVALSLGQRVGKAE